MLQRYDPDIAPDPDEWLGLDEAERIVLVEDYHRRIRVKLPSVQAHSAIHAAVENQIAEGRDPSVRAMARLLEEGLDRHNAVHAIGNLIARQIYLVLHDRRPPDEVNAWFREEIEALTAESWLKT